MKEIMQEFTKISKKGMGRDMVIPTFSIKTVLIHFFDAYHLRRVKAEA
jgi:hypothetical protein